jgi:outer membrane protein assembly factor BamB
VLALTPASRTRANVDADRLTESTGPAQRGSAMDRSIRLGAAGAAILIVALVLPGTVVAARAAAMVLTPDSGPPTSAFSVSLSRLPANAGIAIKWDAVELGRGTANSRGALILPLNVPKEASPGPHDVTAVSAEGGDVSKGVFIVRTDWTQFHGHPDRSGVNRFENVLSAATVGGIIINDRVQTNGSIDGSPVVCDGKVAFGSADGAVRSAKIGGFVDPWLFQTRGAITGALAAIPPGPCVIMAGSTDGTLYALDGATGTPKWKVGGKSPITSPLLIRGFDPQPDPPGRQMIVGDEGGQLRAFDLRGRRLWATQLDAPIAGTAAWTSVPVNPMAGAASDVTIQQLDPGDRIYATTTNGSVYGLDPTTGAVLIAIRLGTPVIAGPAVVNLTAPPEPEVPAVLVGDTKGVLHALFGDDLSEAWNFQTGDAITTLPASLRPDEIGEPWVIGNPGLFVASGDGSVYGLAADTRGATAVWTTPIGSALNSSPSIANGVVYLGADDSKLHALDALSGRELFTSGVLTDTRSSPVVVDGHVLVGTSHGELIDFSLPR